MALSIIQEKDKIINQLSDAMKEGKPDDSILLLQQELPELSPENSQYPEGASDAGGDSTILDSQKLSFKLWKRLKDISENDNLLFGQSEVKQKSHQPETDKKSYNLNSVNPYMQKPKSTQIVTTDSNLNTIIQKIESDIHRKRKATEMEEFFDIDESKDVNEISEKSEGTSSILKINKKIKPSGSNPRPKRNKPMESPKDSHASANVKKSKKLNISRTDGWTFKNKKAKKSKKDYDAFEVLESSKDINETSHPLESPKKKKGRKAKQNMKAGKMSKSTIGKYKNLDPFQTHIVNRWQRRWTWRL